MNLVAHIFGFFALIIYLISLQYNKKSKIVKFQIISNIFYALQYLMLNAYTGIYASLIGTVRSIILYKYDQHKKQPPIFILFIILGLTIYSVLLGYSGLISLIPIIGGISFSISIWQKNLTIFRIVCVMNSIIWLIYNIYVGAYVSIIGSILEFIFTLTAFIKIDILKKD